MMPVTLEAAEKDPIRKGRLGELDQAFLELGEVDMAVGVLGDLDHGGDRLAPAELIGVVFVGPNEDHRPFGLWDMGPEGEPIVEAGREPKPEDRDQAIDGTGRAGAGEDDGVVVIGPDTATDEGAGLLAKAGGLKTGSRSLGVGVGVKRQDRLPDEVLDEVERAGGGGVVGVGDLTKPVGGGDSRVGSDHRLADRFDQPLGFHAARLPTAARQLPRFQLRNSALDNEVLAFTPDRRQVRFLYR